MELKGQATPELADIYQERFLKYFLSILAP
jgi:hypothetical protein